MAMILVVEDDKEIAESIIEWLEMEKFAVAVTTTGEEALQLLEKNKYDLLLLDWTLPGINGYEVFKRYRASDGKAPVIFVTGRYELENMDFGSDGPDDFIMKPFNMRELSARIQLRLKKPGISRFGKISLGNILLDQETKNVFVDSRAVRLTKKEYAVLEFLIRHPNQIFSSQAVLEAAWAAEAEPSAEALATCIRNLRRKMASDGQECLVKAIAGAGYTAETIS